MKYNKELMKKFIKRKVHVATRTQEEYHQFMELLEKNTDIRWNSGHRPTEKDYWCDTRTETKICTFGNDMYYQGSDYGVSELVEFKDLIKEKGMNKIEKMHFLIDRMEDGQPFMFSGNVPFIYQFIDGVLNCHNGKEDKESTVRFNTLLYYDLSLITHTFTEDEFNKQLYCKECHEEILAEREENE